jgi:hypothetical protein
MPPHKGLLQGSVSQDKQLFVFAILVIVACIAAYGLALNGPLFFDDIHNLTTNYSLQISTMDFDAWRVAVISSDAGLLHRPIAMFTFALNYAVSGQFSPFALKASNLLIHLLTGGMIFYLCLALLRAPGLSDRIGGNHKLIAMTAAAIWLLHPLHVSTVLYAIQRMAQLSTLFVIAGLLFFAHCRLRWCVAGASVGELIATALWLMILGGLAVLSKENGALLPWLMAVVEVTLFCGIWQGRRIRLLVWLGWLALLLPLLLVALVFVLSPETLSSGFAGREFSLEERLMTQGRLLWRYLGWILLPNIADMGFFHDDISLSRSLWAPLSTALSLVAWVGTIIIAVVVRERYPLFSFALLFYLVAHSLESTVLPLEMVFEHRNYLPSVGVVLLMAVLLTQLALKLEKTRARFLLAGVLSLLALLLVLRTHAWTDELTLARYNVASHPRSARANFFYGNALFRRLENAQALGLDEEQQRDLTVASRHYFEQMYDLDQKDFAALVMLHQFDRVNFPGLSVENDWLGKLDTQVKSRRLQASDISALEALVSFSASSAGEAGRIEVGSILEQLVQRYPGNPDIVTLYYKYLAVQTAADKDQLRQLLEQKVALHPDTRDYHAFLVNYHGYDDLAATHETIRAWMKLDSRRRDLYAIRRIFDN